MTELTKEELIEKIKNSEIKIRKTSIEIQIANPKDRYWLEDIATGNMIILKTGVKYFKNIKTARYAVEYLMKCREEFL